MIMTRSLGDLRQIIASQGIVADADWLGNKIWYKKDPETGAADKENPVTNPVLTVMLDDIPTLEGFLADYQRAGQMDVREDVYFNQLGQLTGQGTGPGGVITAEDWSQIGVILASKGADAAIQQVVLDAEREGDAVERTFLAWQTERSEESQMAFLEAQQDYGNAQFTAQQELQAWQQTGQWEHDATQRDADRTLSTWTTTAQQTGETDRQKAAFKQQTDERLGAEKYATGDREDRQTQDTAERKAAQTWQTGERLGGGGLANQRKYRRSKVPNYHARR